MNYVKNEILKNVNFVKSEFSKCEFSDKLRIFAPVWDRVILKVWFFNGDVLGFTGLFGTFDYFRCSKNLLFSIIMECSECLVAMTATICRQSPTAWLHYSGTHSKSRFSPCPTKARLVYL